LSHGIQKIALWAGIVNVEMHLVPKAGFWYDAEDAPADSLEVQGYWPFEDYRKLRKGN